MLLFKFNFKVFYYHSSFLLNKKMYILKILTWFFSKLSLNRKFNYAIKIN